MLRKISEIDLILNNNHLMLFYDAQFSNLTSKL